MEPMEKIRATFHKTDDSKIIIGMIHLAGEDPLERAEEETQIFFDEGLDGVIVENYHADKKYISPVLERLVRFNLGNRLYPNMKRRMPIGINVLPNEYDIAFMHAASLYRKNFIQLDHVAGKYVGRETIDAKLYEHHRKSCQEVAVLGGVWPKYYTPEPESNIDADLMSGMRRADAIVVTGEGTGMETPIEKIKYFREAIGDFPLIIGAGVTADNAYEQLRYADGAIIGSYFKNGDTTVKVDVERVRELMQIVKEI